MYCMKVIGKMPLWLRVSCNSSFLSCPCQWLARESKERIVCIIKHKYDQPRRDVDAINDCIASINKYLSEC